MKNLVFVIIAFVFMTLFIGCEKTEVNEETGVETVAGHEKEESSYESDRGDD